MARRTFRVGVNANALRTMSIRASSPREALEIAQDRIKDWCGPWTIDFPGSEDEHYSVWIGEEYFGPYADGSMQGEGEADQ